MLKFGSKESIEILIENTPIFQGLKEGEEHQCDCEHCDIRGETDRYLCEECAYEYEDFSDMGEVCSEHKECINCGNKFIDNRGKISQLKSMLKK